ncbi:GDSL esterase/lipase-like protein [Tanacetum coccineum]
MAYEIKLLFTVLVVLGLMQVQTLVVGEPQVPCYFIFGDALVDSGNNNKLVTVGKANYLPYGIDFPQGVTGQLLGIREEQSHIYTTGQYAAVLSQRYSQQLTTLYNLGARKIAVYGLGLIGCAPTEITRFGTDGRTCVESINNAVGLFNDMLKPVVDMLNSDFSDARFTFINLTNIQATQGGEVLPNVACCQVRPSDGQCVPNSIPCPVRALSLWYDGFHPTEIVNTIFATRSYTALSTMDASPYDISHLARL